MNWITHFGVSLLFAVPAIGYVYDLKQRKVKLNRRYADPFRDQLLRPPGESTRLRIGELEEELDDIIVQFLFWTLGMSLVFGLTTRMMPPHQMVVTGALLLALAVPLAMLQGRKLVRLIRILQRMRLGFAGERAVGEELNQMLADGYQVFHDVPMSGFNVDHVVVGPTGAFAVETKARRKPKLGSQTPEYRVRYDGQKLVFPRWTEKRCLEQAKRQAAGLSEFLSGATGEPVSVSPIVALPGWFVEASVRGDPAVLNPRNIRNFVTSKDPVLADSAIERICHQLDQRCRS
ncbi:MAG: nuclease-related domain-containing protein [Opitutaceae bacterium]